ncbi:centrosomal protein of 85 kDa-like isoform X1 [Oncorhynchus tshawytscha]|uniref:Centrosomal protein of 85 kDa-like n=1 Tax=Oncorhynchus tshawytscha TaxID=74940 RepID=A0A8C8MH43_ONCTS|nr:centrosomal protein of 85 kDa-like isoform X1 [Oncorhynchus tshawytscha]
MWGRNEFEDGFDTFKTGSNTSPPGWVPGCESSWQGTSSAPGTSNRGRRHSGASDSGDTGIGTSCSDSVEDHSSSSTTLSFQPLRSQGALPTAHVMPSPSTGPKLSTVPSPGSNPWSSCQLPSPLDSPLDMKDPRPVRRWSSLTRLSPQEKTIPGGRAAYRSDPHGSLDRGVLYGYRHDPLGPTDPYLSHLHSPGAEARYKYPLSTKTDSHSACSSPLKPNTLDLTYSALPETKHPGVGLTVPSQRGLPLGHQTVGGSPIQPAVRTQMWLSEQMEYRPPGPGPELCGALSAWQQEQQQQQRERLRQEAELNQMLGGASLPVNTLVKIKEGLLRQRELEIDRQKQQILQLHARIRENELKAQQVLQSQKGRCDDPCLLKAKESPYDSPVAQSHPQLHLQLHPQHQLQVPDRMSPLCCDNGELGRKLAAAELEVIHLNEFLKQNTQKYTEDIKKLEDKMKTRDRYINSLKKKCQRESEQNQEKQQRIETLEKYLADLPSLDEVQTQAQQLEESQGKAQDLQDTVARLEKNLEEGRTVLQEKEDLIETQCKREKELVAAVQSLQEKVEQCLEDGVRLPMLDLKQLEVENAKLQEQQATTSKLIDKQKNQIEKLTLELTAVEQRLQKERCLSQELQQQLQEKDEALDAFSCTLHQNRRQVEEGVVVRQGSGGQGPEAGPLLKEMSLCLLDLKALCSILTQRAQGKEPNLALLLGIKSMSMSGEENDNSLVEDNLRAKLLEVGQLRKDIDDLRTAISDRYAQDMGDNCVTQ